MYKAIAILSFSIIALLSCLTLLMMIAIFYTKSFQSMWKKSPSLALFHVSNILLAVQSLCCAGQWILFALGVIENVPENLFQLLSISHAGMVITQFNYYSTVALFLQRIYHLLFPANAVKRFNTVVLSILFAASLISSILPVYTLIAKSNAANGRPVPEGCYSIDCLNIADTVADFTRLFQFSYALCRIVVLNALGVYMLYLLRKHAKNIQSVLEKKNNSFARYVFCLHVFVQMLPFGIDTLLASTAHIHISEYIGPYGVLGCAIDFTVQTLVYYSTINMDCLPSDLIDHLVHFLPMADVKTIIKATAGSADLAAWNEVAEDHLRERFVLHLSVYLPCNDDEEDSEDSTDSEYDEGDYYNDAPTDEYAEYEYERYYIPPKRPKLTQDEKKKEEKKLAPFLISVHKGVFDGIRPISHWKFKNSRYAWLESVTFHSYQPNQDEMYQPYELQDILRIISLPIAPRGDTRYHSTLSLDWIRPTAMDSALKMLNVLPKTFTQIIFSNHRDGIDLKVEEFLSDYLDRETSLKHLWFIMEKYDSSAKQVLADRIVAFFNRKKLVEVSIPKGMISDAQGEKIFEHWLNSDGFSQGYKEFRRFSEDWNLCRKPNSLGYLIHPSNRSSLHVSYQDLKIVKFEPWHVPVTMKWMDALIDKWRNGGGLYICKKMRQIELLMENEEWTKLLAKSDHQEWISTLFIKHPRIDIDTDRCAMFSATRSHTITDYPVFFAHPVANARLKIDRHRFSLTDDFFRISAVPIDTEAVEDWNLDKLFELR
ncbi:hypothetical protein QR680_010220 [Steinernema hermaphroditum]|uniref:Uncharacterized protein n=1 Tax=Steinernema hermaphroditum TaxID=289476 RepID=A0AA39MAA6_9BILA|nr:hypothetical protein QR680_010220 [Steinernema hermaphroditum]